MFCKQKSGINAICTVGDRRIISQYDKATYICHNLVPSKFLLSTIITVCVMKFYVIDYFVYPKLKKEAFLVGSLEVVMHVTQRK